MFHPDFIGHHTEVIPDEVDDRSMFGGLLRIGHQRLQTTFVVGPDGSFHRTTTDFSLMNLQEGFGGETDEFVFEP